jgi:hypothetical protein
VTIGEYSSALKNQLDHSIPLISHRFTTLQGETHHEPRYARFPSVLAVGLMESFEAEAVRVFERLVSRNAINMHTAHFASRVLTRDELPDLQRKVGGWFDDLAASQPPRVAAEPLVLDAQRDLPLTPPRRALLLHGSPRGNASVSASIATYLAELLTERGLSVEATSIQHAQHADGEFHELQAAVDRTDVVALATPLYVDSLPGPLIRAFETLARGRGASSPRFLAIVDSGFPEAVHNHTALAACRLFARQAKLDWLGGLAIGGGGMLAGKPLAKMGARARWVTRALPLTADAIVEGRTVPDEAQRLVRQQAIPTWLSRFFGDYGFRAEAKKHGSLARLRDRPYAA